MYEKAVSLAMSSESNVFGEKVKTIMFGLGPTELIIILIIVLVIFGAKKLPEIGSGLGKGITNFKKAVKDQDSIESNTSEEQKE